MHTIIRNLVGAAALAIVAVGAQTLPSLAHTELTSSVPAADAVVEAMPETLVLTFSESIEPAFSKIEIIGPDGLAVGGTSFAIDPANGASVIVTLPAGLPGGSYTVDWAAVAVDGHKVSGTYSFDVK
ncbi:MAG: copper homeostasis periplasmic binding protein CopC [Devosia sp.]|uniref:copper homeostasis periplasmic binding protein CopC n=1 Tax=Devosia sp. TaxID=1871048 RepID=UPI001A3B8B06|nr:copper homeostasis periplasmic binding protein CopC [Devosia sp.]MBL8596526.1 copper homeostasis periplasmic binding protein CopC [Devosia sp.]